MRSLEKSHRGADIDQINPEHINREAAEFSWNNLNKVPFNGNQRQSSEKTADAAGSWKNMVDSLPTDDETIQAKREGEARRRVQAVFQKMDSVASFGKNARSSELSNQEFRDRVQAQEAGRNDDRKLSDISTSF